MEKIENKRCLKCVNRMYMFCPCEREEKDIKNLNYTTTKMINLYKIAIKRNPGSEVIRELSDEIKKLKKQIQELA